MYPSPFVPYSRKDFNEIPLYEVYALVARFTFNVGTYFGEEYCAFCLLLLLHLEPSRTSPLVVRSVPASTMMSSNQVSEMN